MSDKPKFDPSKPFDAAKPKFDPNKAFEPLDQPADTSASQAQTALEHFGNGASFGYLPQLQAAAERGVDAIGEAKDKALDMVGLDHLASIDHQLRAQGFKLPDETYLAARDANIKRLAKQSKDNPWTAGLSNVAGGVAAGGAATPLMGAPAATGIGRMAKAASMGSAYGGLSNPGDVEGEVSPVQAKERGVNALIGGVLGAGTQGLAETAHAAPGYLKNLAEKSAVNATGATGAQASKFEDDAGRQLLDRGLVRFGDSQENIAGRVTGAADAANKQIDNSLSKLDASGVKVNANDLYNRIRDKINSLKGDPSQSDVVKVLEGELDNLLGATDAKGSAEFGVQEAENIKRGYNRKAGNWADPDKGQAGKEMYQTFRGGVEDAAQAADPSTSDAFQEGKKTYGLLAPIKEAAERRASTTAQSPAGGLLDMATAGAGFAGSGPLGAVAAPIARRVIAPRMSSSIAVGADKMSKFLMQSPRFAEMAQNSPGAFQAAVSRMEQRVSGRSMKAASTGPDQRHVVSEDEAKEQFLNGN